MNLTDISKQLRLAADIIEAGHPWSIKVGESFRSPSSSHVINYVGTNEIRPILATPPDGRPLHNPDNLDAPPFQLPPPPPGMSWHRTDGWKAEDLPPGTRPLCDGEASQAQDQVKVCGSWLSDACDVGMPMRAQHLRTRTTRPLVFTHAGKSWTWHRPGDPMPCDGEREVQTLLRWQADEEDDTFSAKLGKWWDWRELRGATIIGWRYAEPITKEVELGPEDVIKKFQDAIDTLGRYITGSK